jgi:hypothetical protein
MLMSGAFENLSSIISECYVRTSIYLRDIYIQIVMLCSLTSVVETNLISNPRINPNTRPRCGPFLRLSTQLRLLHE